MSAFLIFLSTFIATSSFAKMKVISSNSELNSSVYNKFKSTKKNSAELQADIRRYLNNHSFYSASVSINSTDDILISRAFKWEVFFENNTNLTDYELRELLRDKDFQGDPKRFLDEVKLLLTSEYKKRGFHFIKIKAEKKELTTSDNKRAIFYIDEKSRVKIDKIRFTRTDKKFTNKKLKKLLIEYSGSPINKGFFSLSSIRSGLQSLKNDFNNLGYFRSNFSINQVKFNTEQNKATIIIDSEINKPTLISKIRFNGNKEVSSFWLNILIGLRKSEPINLYDLEKGLETIKNYYSQRGFLEADIEEDDILLYDSDLRSVVISIDIKENEQILVSNIKIKGLEKTRKYVVEKELDFKNGEVLTQSKLQNSSQNLRSLGVFTKVNIDTTKKSGDKKGRTILVDLSEKKPGVFTTGVGISNERDLTYKIYAGLGYRNLHGKARSVSSRAEFRLNNEEPDYLENRLLFSFLEPYFLNSKTKARINLSGTNEIWDVKKDLNEVTIVKSLNFSTALERNISKHFKASWSVLDVDRRDISEREGGFKEVEEFIISTGPKIELDYRNNPFLPSKGSFSKFSFDYGGFGSTLKNDGNTNDVEFIRLNALHTFYKEINPKLIFAQSFQGGYLRNIGDGAFFPKSRAFFLGGALSIRGFDPSRDRERIPNDNQLIVSNNGRVQGGGLLELREDSYYYLTKSELRFPLFEKSNIWGAIFYDAGAVRIPEIERDFTDLKMDSATTGVTEEIDKWRHTIGVGIRWNTPIGPLNLEVGYKLDRKRDQKENAFRFHISVGSF